MKTPTFLANMSAKTEKRILWAIAAVLVMAVIFAFSSQASFASEETSDALADLLSMEQQDLQTRVSNQSILFGLTFRKLAHIFLFAALGFCLYQALADVKRRLVIAAGAAYLYGVLDEIHQSLAGRHGRWQDTLIDLIGIALGIAAALLLPKLNTLCKKWFYEDWDLKHPVAKKRLEWYLDALSLAAVMQYVGYRFLQTTMFEFIYSERYKTLTFLSLLVFGGMRFVYLFARKLWTDADEKAQIRRFLKFVGVCVLALPFFIVAYLHDYKVLIFIPICWMCLYDMQAELVCRWFTRVIGILMASTLLCCAAGMLKSLIHYDYGVGRFIQSFGIINTTDYAAYYVFLLLFAWCSQMNHRWYISLAFILIMLAAGGYLYKVTASLTSMICLILSAVVCAWEFLDRLWSNRWKRAERLFRFVDKATLYVVPLVILAFAIGVYLWGQGSALGQRFDQLLSGRLHYTWNVYTEHGVNLLGNSFTMHGLGASLIRDTRAYNFIDSSYAYMLIRYGVVLTAVIISLWIWTTRQTLQSDKKRITLSMIVIGLYALSESHFIDVNYNVLLIMPFCAFSTAPSSKGSADQVDRRAFAKPDGRFWLSWLTAIGMGICGYLALPKAISWFRTILYLYGWQKGYKSINGFFCCTLILALLFAVWKSLNEIWHRKSKWIIGIPIGLCVLLAVMAMAGNNKIEQGLSSHQDDLKQDAEGLQMVLDSAEYPVYALEKAELYQRFVGGFSEKIMMPEDILYERHETIITDKAHELPVSMIYGGKYLQMSDVSGVYSFDQVLIDRMTEAGYEWNTFYDSERTCDLKDLAKLNGLRMSGSGSLVLCGPQNSLNENRYVDQWAGDYEVRFTLNMDTNKTNMACDEAVCTCRILGYKGEETIIEQEALRSDFNEEGRCVITLSYTIPHTPTVVFLISAADGVTLYVDEIAWRRVA